MKKLYLMLICLTLVAAMLGCNSPGGGDSTKTYGIGETGPAGGLVFYDKGWTYDGWRYLEAAPYDQSTGIAWFGGSYTTTGATSTAVGDGQANTTAIVGSQGVGTYAAQLCNDLVLNGFNDWFLPSNDDLAEIWANLVYIHNWGSFTTSNFYWTSSEYSTNKAWAVLLGTGGTGYDKANLYYVRAVRRF